MSVAARQVVGLVIIYAAVIAPGSGGSATAGTAGDSCLTRGRTVVASPDARVYAVPSRRGPDFGQRVYGCLYASQFKRGATRRLGVFHVGDPVDFRLAGRFVAYERLLCQGSSCAGDVRVTDIRRGTTRRSARFGPGVSSAFQLVATPRGGVAWIRASLGTGILELRKLDADGEAVLDSGAVEELDSESLAAGERTIYWQRNGETRSAPVR